MPARGIDPRPSGGSAARDRVRTGPPANNLRESNTQNTHSLPQRPLRCFPLDHECELEPVAGIPGGAVSTERSRMDYCSSCRRTLNGALVCPGCGAYAPDIAPPGHHQGDAAPTTVTAAEAWQAREFSASAEYYDAPHAGPEPTASDAHHAPEGAMADVSDAGPFSDSEYTAAPVPEGRAARRRQMARWKKQRRRAVVASTVALVGGGLTLAVLPSRPSTGHDTQASATPEPKATATTGTDATETDSSSVRPRTEDSQGSGSSARSSAITSPPRKATTLVARTSTKNPRQTTIAARPTATTSAQPRTTTATVTADEAPTANPPAPETTPPPPPPPPPPPADDSTADTPPPSPPPTTTKPDRLCVLVLCIGGSAGN
ncbi:SCO2400 family protein [Streptomyces scopuliridis]|uniref:SCO2400 family protein n=2 Tax=Streptomyces scopuliridis TaxID=452529 RepID=UPI003B968DD2